MGAIKMKIIICILFLMLFVIIGAGCMRKSLTELAIEHINEKYDDTFVYLKPDGVTTEKTKSFYVTSERFPDEAIAVRCVTQDDGTTRFYDNYLGFVYEAQTRELIDKTLSEVYGEENVLFDYGVYHNASIVDLSGDATFEQYINLSNSNIFVNVYLRASEDFNVQERDEKFEEFRILLKAQSFSLRGFMQYVKSEYWYLMENNFNGNGKSEALGMSKLLESCIFTLNEDYSWKDVNWSE